MFEQSEFVIVKIIFVSDFFSSDYVVVKNCPGERLAKNKIVPVVKLFNLSSPFPFL